MRCYCDRTDEALILYVDDVEPQFEKNLVAAWYEKTGTGYRKIYSMTDKDNGLSDSDVKMVCSNFSRLGPAMFQGNLDWMKALSIICEKLWKNNIEWYVFGSVSDALRGINIIPHDIDIIVHTKDFFKVKAIFSDCVVEPFVDNKGNWVVRYFGRISMDNSYIDVVAAENLNSENHQYDKILWNGYELLIELFENRYQIELKRNRPERLKAMDEYKQKYILE